MTELQQAVCDEVMSVMRERSVDAGYSTIRVGLKSISNEICRESGFSEAQVGEAVDWLLDAGFLIKNGQYTMDIGKGDYFADHQRVPRKTPADEVQENPEEKITVSLVSNESRVLQERREAVSEAFNDDLEKALTQLKTKLLPISGKAEKLMVLHQLARYMHPSIAAVLDEVAMIIESMDAA